MIAVVMEALQDLASEPLGVLVSFDQVFDAVENDLLSQEYLGASGVRAIYESDERLPGTPVEASRALKVLWLLQRVTWVPRVPETVAKLLVRDLTTGVAPLREEVETTLHALQEAGYVSRDEASGEWKFLNERERTIEQAVQEMIRPGGAKSISIATIRRTAQQICKDEVITRKRLASFAVTYGATKVPFSYGVRLDGEAVETGPEIAAQFTSPLASGRKQEIEEARRQNQAGGARGKTIWWVADAPDTIEARFRRYEALVKVTGDKRFTEDASADTQDALSEKRKERDDLKGGLAKDLERAFLAGTVLYGGQEIALDGTGDLAEPIRGALQTIIPNVYPRFGIADRPFDFPKQLKGLLSPGVTNLAKVAPELDLFDTQGSLQRESALASHVLEVLADLEDEGIDPDGARLLEVKEDKGFKGFLRPPFGWPDELVRLILAACFRAGAVYIERQTAAGPTPLYEYQGTDELFGKITAFKKLTFRVAETPLTVEQIKRASKALIAMGVSGTPESGNAIAATVRQLGSVLRSRLDDAKTRHLQGLPIPEGILEAEAALATPTSVKDPTVAVTAFLAQEESWTTLYRGLEALRVFLEANRHTLYDSYRRLLAMATQHPLPESDPRLRSFAQARKDMEAIVAERAVIARWSDFQSACDGVFTAYRDAYLEAYETVRKAADSVVAAIKGGDPYRNAPSLQRDGIIEKIFGAGRTCHYPLVTLSSVESLLEAAGKRSLTSLDQAVVALPGYQAQVEAELRALTVPPPAVGAKIFEWRPAQSLAGKQLATEQDVDRELDSVAKHLKTQIRDGYTIVVK
jgi:hypothetical protein